MRFFYGRVAPTMRRYPFIAARFTHLLATIQPRLLAMSAETDAWWRRRVAEIPAMDLPGALAVAAESLERYEHAISTHGLEIPCVVNTKDATRRLRTGD